MGSVLIDGVRFDVDEIPLALLKEANASGPIRGRVKRGVPRVAIRDALGVVVGFVTPHRGAYGWRLGSIYVTPSARGAGLARAAVLRFAHLGLVHFVPDLSPESHRMHIACGFSVWRRHGKGTWYRLETS